MRQTKARGLPRKLGITDIVNRRLHKPAPQVLNEVEQFRDGRALRGGMTELNRFESIERSSKQAASSSDTPAPSDAGRAALLRQPARDAASATAILR